MTLKFTAAIVGLIMSSSVFAAATLTAPEDIVILAVNDQEVNTGLFRGAKNNYKIDAGENSISVRYQGYFDHTDGEHDILKSGVVTIKTPALQDNQSYQLALINPPQNFEAAKKYAEQPTIGLYDKNHQLLVQQTGANTEAKPWLSSGIFGRAYDLTQKKNAPDQQPAPVYAPVENNTVVGRNSMDTTAEQKLIELWKKSSKAERQKFMAWLAEQSQ